MIPRPPQCSHGSEKTSSRPDPTRLRVIWTRPSEVTSATWCLVRSRPRHSRSRRTTRSRLDSSTMSMKSMTMMPPMSRSRSWRTISSAASRLFLVTVSSRLPPEPTNLPVLTSTTVIASVRSMTSEPPEGSHTLRSIALASCSSIAVRGEDVLLGGPPLQARRRGRGRRPRRSRLTSPHAWSPETTSEVKSSLNTSRMTRTVRSGSPCRSTGAPPLPAFLARARRPCPRSSPRPREALDVGAQLLLGGALGGGAHDDPGRVGHDLLEDGLEPGTLGVGELARDARHRALGHVDEVAARQRDLRGEACALVAHGVLGHLDEHGVTGAQGVLDATGLPALEPGGVPVDLTGVEHGVAALADVDERGLHGRQDVLDAAEVDVAGHRRGRLARDVVLDEHAVLEHPDLGAVAAAAHDHDALDALATGEELGLGDDRAATAGLAALAAALLLGLEARRALDRGRLVALGARLAHPGHGAGRVLVLPVAGGTTTAAAATPAARGALALVVGVGRGTGARALLPALGGVGVGCRAALVVVGRGAPAAATATAAAAARATLAVVARTVVGGAAGRRLLAAAGGLGAVVGGLGCRIGLCRGDRLVGDRPLGGRRGGLCRGSGAAAGPGRLGGLEQQAEARHGGRGGALGALLVLVLGGLAGRDGEGVLECGGVLGRGLAGRGGVRRGRGGLRRDRRLALGRLVGRGRRSGLLAGGLLRGALAGRLPRGLVGEGPALELDGGAVRGGRVRGRRSGIRLPGIRRRRRGGLLRGAATLGLVGGGADSPAVRRGLHASRGSSGRSRKP